MGDEVKGSGESPMEESATHRQSIALGAVQ